MTKTIVQNDEFFSDYFTHIKNAEKPYFSRFLGIFYAIFKKVSTIQKLKDIARYKNYLQIHNKWFTFEL